ncbi:NAD-dependent malic enzyme [Acetobacter fallax]|uniref:Oxaloacetate-decarboxylating malate dehydrogenase n=1 Tax=Acetobacter fallax TaxID=1737473 RepID=A0ABX0KGW9_9PROT|nr:NAD-dependent malic enzyme [Acetobacter fallax]NHO34416.1 oxaloacetate-decarboxylating malate dehydrogenase [Acetobacter fallax]NHO37867.1 oxaloacetate-decarboxylating malate dehydrogenase [Acetobacter fallax]
MIEHNLTGKAILVNAELNKETAFTDAERRRYGLRGLLPPAIETIERQLERVLHQLAVKPSDIERYIYLASLADRNETLFFHTLMSDPSYFVPIVYDPTVAEACLKFGHIMRRSKGMYLTRHMKDEFVDILREWPVKDVRFICVSTGGRILGLGDIGANGMGIPIGKLQLYTACAGVPPGCMLPILLDIGTTNASLRADPLYLGLREEPPEEKEIDAIADAFVAAANDVFPGVCVHFEDWKGVDAMRLLARYRDNILCYNDDIQGTASIVLAGLITALQIKKEKLRDQRIAFFGAGSAGIGIANMIVSAMEEEGLSEAEARARISLMDVNGLIESGRTDLNAWQKPFARDAAATNDLLTVVKTFEPTILIGVSTIGGAFKQDVIEEMARLNDRPIIFPISNPTDKAECTAEQAYNWTNGKALYAAGVQFPDVEREGTVFHPGQANNFYIFPAIGLAVYATRPERITDGMFIAAARATADQVDETARNKGMLFPLQADILQTEVTTATRIAEYIFDTGMASVERPTDIRAWIEGLLYQPRYREI